MTARAGESVILGCDVSPPLDGQQPPYVVEWFKFGVPIPFFINFRFYPPHVDPEYTGKMTIKVFLSDLVFKFVVGNGPNTQLTLELKLDNDHDYM